MVKGDLLAVTIRAHIEFYVTHETKGALIGKQVEIITSRQDTITYKVIGKPTKLIKKNCILYKSANKITEIK